MSRGPVIRSEAYARIPRALPHHSFDIEPRRLSCFDFRSLVRNPTVHLLVSPNHLLHVMLAHVLVRSSLRIKEESSGLRRRLTPLLIA